MTFRVVRMPILWLDNMPIGDALKTFTVDTKLVDEFLLITLSDFAKCFVTLITVVAVG